MKRELSHATLTYASVYTTHDGLIDVDIAVPDFQVKAAIGIGANPGFILYG
jgi:hypothetical protein